MKLWHVSQSVNTRYDTYSDFVCAAETEEAARDTWPRDYSDYLTPDTRTLRERQAAADSSFDFDLDGWATFEHVTATLIGEAIPGMKAGVICASFHAG